MARARKNAQDRAAGAVADTSAGSAAKGKGEANAGQPPLLARVIGWGQQALAVAVFGLLCCFLTNWLYVTLREAPRVRELRAALPFESVLVERESELYAERHVDLLCLGAADAQHTVFMVPGAGGSAYHLTLPLW